MKKVAYENKQNVHIEKYFACGNKQDVHDKKTLCARVIFNAIVEKMSCHC